MAKTPLPKDRGVLTAIADELRASIDHVETLRHLYNRAASLVATPLSERDDLTKAHHTAIQAEHVRFANQPPPTMTLSVRYLEAMAVSLDELDQIMGRDDPASVNQGLSLIIQPSRDLLDEVIEALAAVDAPKITTRRQRPSQRLKAKRKDQLVGLLSKGMEPKSIMKELDIKKASLSKYENELRLEGRHPNP
jgi:hypothetical protein